MARTKLNSLLGTKEEDLKELKKLYRDTEVQLDEAVMQGNNALHDLQAEFDELASKKRELLVQVEELESKYKRLKEKMEYAENTYGKYLMEIREKRPDD